MIPVFRDTALCLPDSGVLEIRRGLDSGKENDRSLAATLRVGPTSILFAGDLESAGEASALPRLAPVQLLKAPHHGSRTSSGEEWVRRLHPAIVLISCGERNRFGHPDLKVLDRYRRAGALVLRTDQEGAIRISFTRSGAWVSTRLHPAPFLVNVTP